MNAAASSWLNTELLAYARPAALVLLAVLSAAGGAAAPHLQEVGVVASFSMVQTLARRKSFSVAQFQLLTDIDGSRLDDTGNRFSACAWVGLLFVQPEMAHSSVLEQAYGITYFSRPSVPTPDSRLHHLLAAHEAAV